MFLIFFDKILSYQEILCPVVYSDCWVTGDLSLWDGD